MKGLHSRRAIGALFAIVAASSLLGGCKSDSSDPSTGKPREAAGTGLLDGPELPALRIDITRANAPLVVDTALTMMEQVPHLFGRYGVPADFDSDGVDWLDLFWQFRQTEDCPDGGSLDATIGIGSGGVLVEFDRCAREIDRAEEYYYYEDHGRVRMKPLRGDNGVRGFGFDNDIGHLTRQRAFGGPEREESYRLQGGYQVWPEVAPQPERTRILSERYRFDRVEREGGDRIEEAGRYGELEHETSAGGVSYRADLAYRRDLLGLRVFAETLRAIEPPREQGGFPHSGEVLLQGANDTEVHISYLGSRADVTVNRNHRKSFATPAEFEAWRGH